MRLFGFRVQRNNFLNTKETLKAFPLSDRLTVENPFVVGWEWQALVLLLFDSHLKTAL